MTFRRDSRNFSALTLDDAEFRHSAGRRLLDEIKRTVPPEGRRYYPNTKKWLIHDTHREPVCALIADFCYWYTMPVAQGELV